MSPILRIAVVIAGGVLIHSVIKDLVRKRLQERQALLWLFTGVGLIIVAIFPQLIQVVSGFFGVQNAPSMIIAMVLIVSIFGIYKCYKSKCELNKQVTELARQVALLNGEYVEAHTQSDGKDAM